MSMTEQHPGSVDELLTPVEQALSRCADDASRAGDAQQALAQLAVAVELIADESWLNGVRTLASLLEIVGCFADGSDEQMAQVSRDIVEFVQTSLPQIGEALEDPQADSISAMLELVDESHKRWGEYLTLVGSGTSWTTSHFSDDEIEAINDANDTIDTASPQQVDLILSALGGGVELADESVDVEIVNTEREPESITPAEIEGGLNAFTPQQVEMDSELLEAYLEDVEQCLGSMERSVLRHEQNPQSSESIQQVERDLHTLKGASASVGLSKLAEHIHGVEEWLQSQERSDHGIQLDPVLNCVDAVRMQVESLQRLASSRPRSAPRIVSQPLTSTRPKAPLPAPSSTLPISVGYERPEEPGDESVRVRSSQLDRLMDILVELVTWRRRRDQRVIEIERAAEELTRCTLRLESVANQQDLGHAGLTAANRDETTAHEQRTRRSLQEITSDVREIASTLTGVRRSLAEENRSVSQFLQEFRQQLVELRRLPLTGLFQRLQRVARDAARVEQKQVRLEFIGEHAGLERSLQERLYEPLLHLVRNAVGHGIETPDDRKEAGKPVEGTITLEAYGSSHLLVLEIRDDGAGLDYDAIRRRGVQRGLLSDGQSATEQELSRLIFQSGFSTRTETNAIAGRGVGMDVVATALDRFNCQIEVDSVRGKGTTIRLSIPLSSVIEHTMIFRAGGQLFGLPTPFVQATSNAIDSSWPPKTVDRSRHLSLTDFLGIERAEETVNQRTLTVEQLSDGRGGQKNSDQSRSKRPKDGQGGQLHFAIDDLLGTEEVVVRPLPSILRRHPLLSGVSLSGAGEVVLLLDGNRFIQAGTIFAQACSDSEAIPATLAAAESPRRILVADDSLSARKRLVQTLTRYRFDITEVGDGAEALDVLRTETFDAVFSDLEMPRLSGFDLLSQLKGSNRHPCEPVVIVTTRTEPEIQKRAHQLGADGFLAKPVSPDSVDDVLRKLDMISLTKN